MVIYTKRGDKGETSLYDEGSAQRMRVSKSSCNIAALGAIDELNSYLGVAVAITKDKSLSLSLRNVQKNLLTIGSILAGSKLRFSSVQTRKLEKLIDELEGNLPVLKNFILPGGSQVSAHLHYARALSRRVERAVVRLTKEKPVKPAILTYLNRLSDTLFMLARNEIAKNGIKERIWKTK